LFGEPRAAHCHSHRSLDQDRGAIPRSPVELLLWNSSALVKARPM
jgi:hypothetical protein